MYEPQSIIWRRLDVAGHEYSRVNFEGGSWYLSGTSIFTWEDDRCKLDYSILCGTDWRTRSAHISGFVGNRAIDVRVAVNDDRQWNVNGDIDDSIKTCIDIDLNFSPITNTLPIRRLNLAVGEKAEVSAAWLRFPNFKFERLDQIYERLTEDKYRYNSGGGSFIREIEVNDFGVVVDYPSFFKSEQ